MMNTKGLLLTSLVFSLVACTTTQSLDTRLSTFTPAPEVEETTLPSPTDTANGSQATKDLKIDEPPLIGEETISCVMDLVIIKECGGVDISD